MVQNFLFIIIFLIILNLTFNFYWVNITNFLGVDLISYGLIILRVWICSLILISRELVFKINNYKEYFLFLILFLLFILYLTFRRINIFLFYLFFERRLIPTLFLILGWGYQPERLQAGLYLLFYTLLASLPLLIGIFFIFYSSFSINITILSTLSFFQSFFYFISYFFVLISFLTITCFALSIILHFIGFFAFINRNFFYFL